MTKSRFLILGLLLTACSAAQTSSAPTLRLRISPDKDVYALNDTVLIRAELTNISSTTLCFPKPAQDCALPPIGSLITTGEPVSSESGRYFVCYMDGSGKQGRALDEAVKNDWVKLQPGKAYVARPAKAHLKLDESGRWKLTATYEPPEGSFSREYKRMLQSAAERAGCTLPEGIVVAEPRFITVNAVSSKRGDDE